MLLVLHCELRQWTGARLSGPTRGKILGTGSSSHQILYELGLPKENGISTSAVPRGGHFLST